MPTPRETPYIWSTWLTKLLVGANSCEWAAWFKTNNQRTPGEKVPSTYDWTAARMAHTALLNQAREEYEQLGYTVTTERQNQFYLRSRTSGVTLSGIPDLIAVKGTDGLIIDAKSIKAQPWHAAQVQLYMYAVPRAVPRYKGITFSGLLYYQDSRTPIQAAAINEAFVGSLAALITRAASSKEARRVPSEGECRYCDITRADCPDRAASDAHLEGETDDF